MLQSTNVKTEKSDYQAVSKEWRYANCRRDDSFCLRRKKKKGNIPVFCDNYATFSQSWLCSALLLQCKNSGLPPGHHMKLPRLNKKQNGIQNTGLSLLKALFLLSYTKEKERRTKTARNVCLFKGGRQGIALFTLCVATVDEAGIILLNSQCLQCG